MVTSQIDTCITVSWSCFQSSSQLLVVSSEGLFPYMFLDMGAL